MKCDKYTELFLNLDNKEKGILLFVHRLFCSKCRIESSMFNNALSLLKNKAPYISEQDNITTSVMNTILRNTNQSMKPYFEESSYSYFNWLFVGFIIIAGRLIISYSDLYLWMSKKFGSDFDIPLNIVLGLMITVYSVLFIGLHVEKIKDTVENFIKKGKFQH